MKIRRGILFLFFSLIQTVLLAEVDQHELKIQADTNHIRIGEKIEVQVIVIDHDEVDLQISWPVYSDTLSEKIEVLELLPVDTQSLGDETIYRQLWKVTSFDTGYHQIPGFEVFINGQSFQSDPLEIMVETVEVDTSQAIKNIKGVEDVPISILDWMKYHWKWLVGVSVLMILIVGVYLIIRNKNKEIVYEKEEVIPTLPPFEFAMDRLDKLEKGKFWQSGEIKYYHSELSETIREYLEKEFDFPAMEQTTREVMRSIRLSDISQKQQKQLHKLLLLSDLVKYAKEKPIAAENEEMMGIARAFLNENQANKPEKEAENEA